MPLLWIENQKRGMRETKLLVDETSDKLEKAVRPLEANHTAGYIPKDFLIIEFLSVRQLRFRRHKKFPQRAGSLSGPPRIGGKDSGVAIFVLRLRKAVLKLDRRRR